MTATQTTGHAGRDVTKDGHLTTDDLARVLLDRAVSAEQVAYRIQTGDDVPQLRRAIRKLAHAQAVPIRTAVIADVLAVVLNDAAIWTEPTATMKAKLTPASEPRPGQSPPKGASSTSARPRQGSLATNIGRLAIGQGPSI
jgi:hypothetical protein